MSYPLDVGVQRILELTRECCRSNRGVVVQDERLSCPARGFVGECEREEDGRNAEWHKERDLHDRTLRMGLNGWSPGHGCMLRVPARVRYSRGVNEL